MAAIVKQEALSTTPAYPETMRVRMRTKVAAM
jgi:hypothetical protein